MPDYSVPLFDLDFGEEEERSVVDTVRSRWISAGAKTVALERRFAEHLGAGHAVAVSSGTAALHLALAMLVDRDDEVIVPSLTFVATVSAVRYVGARPVFADIRGAEDLSIDAQDVSRKLTPRTRAIVPMHYAGFPCDMNALTAIARDRRIGLVEDATHAPDSEYGGRKMGTFGEFGCFSFFSNKNISCAEGGMLVAGSEEHAERARRLRSHGMTSLSYDRARGHATAYDVVELGYNYRLDDLRAGLALTQLDKLASGTERRRLLRARYLDNLGGHEGIVIPYRDRHEQSSNYIFPVVLPGNGPGFRDLVRARLADRGIQTSVHYPAVHRFEIFRDPAVSLPNTEFVAANQITLPLFSTMSPEQVDQVCEALVDALRQGPR
jgi:dTDP-4-amino-4,6-dideoxygalactose transaminase